MKMMNIYGIGRYEVRVYTSNTLDDVEGIRTNDLEYAITWFNSHVALANRNTTNAYPITFDKWWFTPVKMVLVDRKHKEILKKLPYRAVTQVSADYDTYYVKVYTDLL